MTLPLFLIDDGALVAARLGDVLVLDGEEGRHAVLVRRTAVGERVEVGDGSGRVASCVVTATGRNRLDLCVDGVRDEAEPRPRFVLAQALAKGGRDEQAVEIATEVGVDAIVPWQATRSVVVWQGERGERARQRWVAVARGAAKQSRRARVPQIGALCDTAALAALVPRFPLALVLHEDAGLPLTSLEPADAAEVLVVVGPEGGLGEDELARLTGAGAVAVRLGPQVLRTSSAGAAALVVLAVRTGRW